MAFAPSDFIVIIPTTTTAGHLPSHPRAGFRVGLRRQEVAAREELDWQDASMSVHRTLGLLVPLHEEYQYLTELSPAVETIAVGGDHYYSVMPPGYKEPLLVQVLEEMGPMRAALATERMISRFDVQIVALLGIAGALDADLRLGDVVIASEVDYYQHGAKADSSTSEEARLSLGGLHWRADYELMQFVRSFSLSPEHSESYDAWRKLSASRRPQFDSGDLTQLLREKPLDFVGPVASGDTVVAGDWLRAALVQRNRRLLAVEMEGAGVAAAAYERADPRRFLVIRGISDFADARKQLLDDAVAFHASSRGLFRRYAVLSATEYFLRIAPDLLSERGAKTGEQAEQGRQPATERAQEPTEPTEVGDVRQELEYELAEKYSTVEAVRRLLKNARVQVGTFFTRIPGQSLDRWFEALEIVEDQHRLCDLLRVVAREYPGNPVFTRAVQAYCRKA